MKIARTNAKTDPQMMTWDTEFWGVRVGRATHLDGLSEWAIENTVGLVCLLVGSIAEAQEAQDRGYRLMDVRVTLNRKTAMFPGSARLISEDDVPALTEIARSAYTLTRFYNDPALDNERCGDLYAEWTRSLCAGAADVVLALGPAGAPDGYVTVNAAHGGSEIGLIAVRSDIRGQGHGEKLVRSALDWARSHGAAYMGVVTQGANVGALRTFEGCGFRVLQVQYWLHRWHPEILS